MTPAYQPTMGKLRRMILVDPDGARNLQTFRTNPWDHYRRETPADDAVHLAQLERFPHTTVEIHQVEMPEARLSDLRRVTHPNIAELSHAYWHQGTLSMVYEATLISLKDILTFCPHWGLAETATLCRGVLSALKYLHDACGISHGALDVDNIRFMPNGMVKLGEQDQKL